MRSLELFLLHPLPDSAQRDRFPALRRLLSRARGQPIQPGPVEAALLSKFDVPRQHDWPVGPFARMGDGQQADRDCWLCADPIHLQVDRDALVLVEPSRFELDQSDADALVLALNAHFDAAGIHFTAPTAKRWYARLAHVPDIETIPLRDAAGRNVESLLPSGTEALAWHRTFNEIQMLLHNHSVNEAREARGELAVNSVWLWGAGRLPERISGSWVQVCANDALSRGLARAAGIQSVPVPHDFAQWDGQARDGDHLIVCEQDDIQAIDGQWLAPALQALQSRSLSKVRLTAPAGSAVQRFDLVRGDLWKFWRSAAA
jgi:hypothetical protein